MTLRGQRLKSEFQSIEERYPGRRGRGRQDEEGYRGQVRILAKKKADGTIEWAHFVERDNGLKEKVLRGTVNSPDEFNIVIDIANNNLRRIFGVTMQPADYEVRTLDGKKASDTIH